MWWSELSLTLSTIKEQARFTTRSPINSRRSLLSFERFTLFCARRSLAFVKVGRSLRSHQLSEQLRYSTSWVVGLERRPRGDMVRKGVYEKKFTQGDG